MKLLEFSKELIHKEKNNSPILSNSLAVEISFSDTQKNSFKEISEFTNSEGLFASKSGAVGWEYGLQIVYFIDEIYIGSPIKGNYSSVSMGGEIKAVPVENKGKYFFNLQIGKKNHKTRDYSTSELSTPHLRVVGNFHTHPKYYHSDGRHQYTFFSPQDIFSLLNSNMFFLGLIAGEKIWLAVKTASAQSIPNTLLEQASRLELSSGGFSDVFTFVKTEMKNFGIVFYYGSIKYGIEKA